MRTLFIIPLVLISLVSFPSWSETLTMDDLVWRDDLYYKKFTNVPFTGEVSGLENGSSNEFLSVLGRGVFSTGYLLHL